MLISILSTHAETVAHNTFGALSRNATFTVCSLKLGYGARQACGHAAASLAEAIGRQANSCAYSAKDRRAAGTTPVPGSEPSDRWIRLTLAQNPDAPKPCLSNILHRGL